ncbi:23S rRNA (pseudouridine(1915)-N(3))-methyltransferase RlmH [Methylocystis bryophila]|uniref:Ribosomal RNA large subunit methyltransferase H n=1 Tax=Methylocystis bryophila TaxID=655015 RepID=A0A1W6MQL4_9HYPH|nr:23S rRNA (pseudouridine(1915)-N(3))-methyltransferase RlmH [Methylocystis bryophila]ARN79891.1 23S rRNA (pseudouridine(1915)-N(3))-methyltransferase RlmH [Methylocystis bryophila]BDV39781.1 ribosomal RNA large subunit methyltransferase H [Methylocystis bryophila]
MRLGLLCVGRLKAGPERELFQRYAQRIADLRNLGLQGLEVKEISESRARAAAQRIAEEGAALLTALPEGATFAVFDERGEAASSAGFAGFIQRERDRGRTNLWFAVGGSEGLDAALRERATVAYSFGKMTLPHQLVRILAAEQIYRAMTMLAGHPYHRE